VPYTFKWGCFMVPVPHIAFMARGGGAAAHYKWGITEKIKDIIFQATSFMVHQTFVWVLQPSPRPPPLLGSKVSPSARFLA
jgi:hypothetical protein